MLKIVPGGPAARSGLIHEHDTLTNVDGICVVGTESDYLNGLILGYVDQRFVFSCHLFNPSIGRHYFTHAESLPMCVLIHAGLAGRRVAL